VRKIIGEKSVKRVLVHTQPGYRGKVNLSVPDVKISEDQMMGVTKSGKKALLRAKKQRQKV